MQICVNIQSFSQCLVCMALHSWDSIDLSIVQLGAFSAYSVLATAKNAASGMFPGGHMPKLPQGLKSNRNVWVIGQD